MSTAAQHLTHRDLLSRRISSTDPLDLIAVIAAAALPLAASALDIPL